MTLKNFMILNAVMFVPFAGVMILVPNLLFPFFGIDLDMDGILMARVFGSALMNFGLICYFARLVEVGSVGWKAILIGNFLFHAIDATTTFIASYTHVMNTLGWMFCTLHFCLALGFLYFLLARKM